MAKRVMTAEESALYNELKGLVRKANQRMDRVERLTGEKYTFAAKELYDELSSSTLNALTKKKGRISLKSSYNLTQMRAIKKATEKYLDSKTSTVRGIKKTKKKFEENAGKEMTYDQIDDVFQAGKEAESGDSEDFQDSEYWIMKRVAKEEGWDQETFIEQVGNLSEKELDPDKRARLEKIYLYIQSDEE